MLSRLTSTFRPVGWYRRGGQLALRWFVLMWFVVSSIGVPLNLFSSSTDLDAGACAIRPGSKCCCSPLKRLSGSCCCGKTPARDPLPDFKVVRLKSESSEEPANNPGRTSSNAGRSCCSKPTHPRAPSEDRDVKRSRDASIVAIESCPCGPDSNSDQLVNHDPRLPVAPFIEFLNSEPGSWKAMLDALHDGAQAAPPTPPPRV